MTQRRKFLRAIYEIQNSFGVDFVGVSRTFSFGIKPNDSERARIEEWFDRVNAIKGNLYRVLFDDFKKSPSSYLGARFDYGRFKGKNLIKGVPTQPLQEGLRMEVQGSINSFIKNHKLKFDEAQKNADSICKLIKRNKEIINSNPKAAIFDFDTKLLLSLLAKLRRIDYESVRSTFNKFQAVNELLNRINNLIGDYNYELNRFTMQNKINGIKKLDKLSKLASFPRIKPEYISDPEILLKELEQLARKTVDQNKAIVYIQKAAERARSFMEGGKENLKSSPRRSTSFDCRLSYWLERQEKNVKHKVEMFIQILESKISRLKQHILKKPYDRAARIKYLNLLGLRARLSHGVENEKVNLLRSRYIGEFLRIRSEREVITLPGFSWKGQVPLKNVALGFRGAINGKSPNIESLFVCIATSSKPFRVIKDTKQNNNFFFIKTSGGARKKTARKPKTIEYLPGIFDQEGDGMPLMLRLHFGRSQARRYLTNVKWGLLSSAPRVFLNNARLKRTKRNPGDPWQYFFDITLSADKGIYKSREFFKNILRKVKAVIGIDRGEVNPIAYAVVSAQNGSLLTSGVLGRKEYREKLDEYVKKKKLQQSRGRLVSKSLREKIARLQKTTLETAISEILHLAAAYRAAIAIEDLGSRPFRGSEKSIIPRKTYKKIETLLANSLNFAGLLRITQNKPKYLGNLMLVHPYATSSTCMNCEAVWLSQKNKNKSKAENGLSFYLEEIVAYSKGKNFVNVDFQKRIIAFRELRLSLNDSWVIYDSFRRREVKFTLDDLNKAITQGEMDKAERLLRGALSHRPDRDVFVCHHCGFSGDADLNAAVNIARRGWRRAFFGFLTKSETV